MKYFSVSMGLRGCYMPDASYVVTVNTRRELKAILESEAYYIRDAGFVGCSKKDIAWLAAEAWRNRNNTTLDLVAPYRDKDQKHYPYGLFCSSATRADYLEYKEQAE